MKAACEIQNQRFAKSFGQVVARMKSRGNACVQFGSRFLFYQQLNVLPLRCAIKTDRPCDRRQSVCLQGLDRQDACHTESVQPRRCDSRKYRNQLSESHRCDFVGWRRRRDISLFVARMRAVETCGWAGSNVRRGAGFFGPRG